MIIQPYLSIDVETTGLDPLTDQILEIGAVYEDGISDIASLKTFRKIAKLTTIHGSPTALSMHADLFKEISEGVSEDLSIDPIKDLNVWLSNLFGVNRTPLTLGGKNVAVFDLPFLIKNGFIYPYNYKIIDIGSCYYSKFGYVPSLSSINQLINQPNVSHKALNDAMNVVVAIRELCK